MPHWQAESLITHNIEIKVVNKIKQPEYIGENRCIPCTVVNIAITIVISLVSVYYHISLGIFICSISLALIYLRGYLVPGTPTLTKRYLPASILQWFGKNPDDVPVKSGLGGAKLKHASHSDSSETNEHHEASTDLSPEAEVSDPDEYFLDLGVLEPCEVEDDLCLTEAFADQWNTAIEQLDEETVSADRVARSFGIAEDDEDYEIESHDEAQILIQDESVVGQWPSNTALLIDIGATTVLADIDPMWETRTPNQKGHLLNGLRLFLEECPGEGDTIKYNEEVVESCCQSHNVLAVTCGDSGERLVEFPLEEIQA